MNYSKLTVSLIDSLPAYLQQVTYFCTNNIHLAMIIIGLAFLVTVVLISIGKRIFFPDSSIIRSAHEKRQSVAKRLMDAKEHSISDIRDKVRKKTSGSKKYILVPYDEWQEFILYKKSKRIL
ncbi:MAG: hypothetical protein RBU23_07315 [Candidatus Auribacterota bacterium]|jgi:hypothetical protein|nr:hypothetical protein [Candidatus Auribacterota bacterium]